MGKIQNIAKEEYVRDQYRSTKNLDVRIQVHQKFSINKVGWQRWLFEQMEIGPNSQILELGCGMGNLWKENVERIPVGSAITVSDSSSKMVEKTKHNLEKSLPNFKFKVIDITAIPFDVDQFDVVIANHMLYHVPDKLKALSEIARVIKPTGRFFASTIGKNHLHEIGELLTKFDAALASWTDFSSESFTLENGSQILANHFREIKIKRYIDALEITDADMLTDYILSGRLSLTPAQSDELRKYIYKIFTEKHHKFFVTKDSGLFQASDLISK